jgi:tRNA dimethylallyltransferase
MYDVYIVYGPTACGKTDLAIRLAKELNGELINADSRQIYKGMDIGTNKGELTPVKYKAGAFEFENSGIIGWLFNLVNPDQNFNVSDWQKLAYSKVDDILARGKTPILVGGTGLYLRALVENLDMQDVSENSVLRKKLNEMTTQDLQLFLIDTDDSKFEAMNNSDQNNPRRLVRAIEIALGRGNRQKAGQETMAKYNFVFKQPEWEKESLFTKIDARVDKMFAGGLIDEVKNLIASGYKNTRALSGIGYKEVINYLDKKISLEEAIRLTRTAHRNYAKRQITWFNKFTPN